MKTDKVFVSGCFDMLHSGHVAFFKEAAGYGDLVVGIGSDQTIAELKGRPTIYSQEERRYMISELRCVKECRINRGRGILDFLEELDDIRPHALIVNEDGHTQEKAEICRTRNIRYIVLKREPHTGLPRRSTTDLRTGATIPYRIDIAGTWIDQPYVSKYHPGAAVLVSIEPTIEFFERSGMASSTRRTAYQLWPAGIPDGKPEEMAKMLFYYDNPPGTKEVSGSQDALGIVMPGLNNVFYDGKGYWPTSIESVYDEDVLTWLENHIRMVTLWPRPEGFNVLADTHINQENVFNLATAAENCWKAILDKDLEKFGAQFRNSFEAQVAMFPAMVNDKICQVIDMYKEKVFGWKLTGAGGGGYLVLVTERDVEKTIKIKIRRRHL
ncbi:MAG TPA: adenylyltransferase/cytidyltransferase family protein [bacterium]